MALTTQETGKNYPRKSEDYSRNHPRNQFAAGKTRAAIRRCGGKEEEGKEQSSFFSHRPEKSPVPDERISNIFQLTTGKTLPVGLQGGPMVPWKFSIAWKTSRTLRTSREPFFPPRQRGQNRVPWRGSFSESGFHGVENRRIRLPWRGTFCGAMKNDDSPGGGRVRGRRIGRRRWCGKGGCRGASRGGRRRAG